MRQLRSCDFCDAADGLGVYEVGPDGANAASRRLVLCPDCRDRLDWVLEPFYDAQSGESATGSADEDVTLLGVSDSRSRSTPDEDEEGNESAESNDSNPNDEGGGSLLGGDSLGDIPVDEGAVTADEGATTADDGDDEAAGEDPTPPTARPAGTSTAERAADDTPPKYRQVMRFLGNRDLPIDRMEAETLASGAYDLEAGEAADIIDTAVERGLLVEEDGKLRPA